MAWTCSTASSLRNSPSAARCFTSQGRLHLRRAAFKFSEEPLDPNCPCQACREHTQAYLHHLIKSDELLGWHLLSIHNLTFYHRLMAAMRASILQDAFLPFYEHMRAELARGDELHPSLIPKPAKPFRYPHLGDYEIYPGPGGFNSVRQISSGEVMHSVNRPDDEANRLYIEQSFLAKRLVGEPDSRRDAEAPGRTRTLNAQLSALNFPGIGHLGRRLNFEML
ncbi:MAG: tRNA-guanine transglycosylase [Lacunisphaera sp.]